MAIRWPASCACKPCGPRSYQKTRARDADWMRSFYGIYLNQLLGYDRIYVLAGDDTPVFGYVAAEHQLRISLPSAAISQTCWSLCAIPT